MVGRTNQRYGRVEKEVKMPAKRRREDGIVLVLILKYFLMRKKSRLISLRRMRMRFKKKRV